jgi:eukaryotic-like serine/threonine-protein kinase
MDFGIARAVSDSAATMTSTAAVIGTAQYLSPEQARGESVDARSDVYSVGCLLYELVCGAPPFTGDSPVSVAYQHVREDPRLPSSINPRIPSELDAILLKAMSKNPANRYQSAADMRTDLLRALAGQRVEATPVMGDAEKTTILGAAPAGYGGYEGGDRYDDEDSARKRRRLIVIGSVVALLVIGGAIAAALLIGGGSPPAAAPAKVSVPNVVGQDQNAATQTLQGAGLQVGTVTQQASTAEQKGRVTATDPVGGVLLAKGSTVALTVGSGPNTVGLPNVVGLTVEAARQNLKSAGFTGSIDTDQVDSVQPKGTVVGADPAQGSQVDPASSVTLRVSDGDAPIPQVAGLSQQAAMQKLRSAGFTNVQTSSAESRDVAPGNAVGTEPGAGQQASAGDEITLLIAEAVPTESSAPATTTAPTSSAAPSTTKSSASTTTGDNDNG